MNQREWIDTISREYLHDFVKLGGSAVKFVMSGEACRSSIATELRDLAEKEGYIVCSVDSSKTKIHMVDKLFYEVAKQIEWDALTQTFVRNLFKQNLLRLPEDATLTLSAIAALNDIDEKLLRRDLNSWLSQKIFRDFAMSQDFRLAMTRLCSSQVDARDVSPFLSESIKDWLRGDLRSTAAVKEALIFQKIGRHTARDMLLSLAHWVRLAGKSGLVLLLDISRYMAPSKVLEEGALNYSVPATLDAYELLRQFVDGTDELEGSLIVVIAPQEFAVDEKRGVQRYDALRLRIWDEVRDRNKENPLAPLLRIDCE